MEYSIHTRFDKAYYDRYYRNPDTRATTPAAARRQAGFIAAYLRYLQLRPKRILDAGCGTGLLLRALSREFPRASLQGLEVSEYLCRRYGWTRDSVATFRSTTPFDLVVCNDVLAYLDDRTCSAALNNLISLTKTALYIGVLTAEDLALCDLQRTDPDQAARPAAWYRRRLNTALINVGGGLYLRDPPTVTVWTLDRLS